MSGSNGGKTHQALWLAYHIIKAGRRVFIFDADDGIAKIGREVEPFIEIADSPNLYCEPMYDWDDANKAIDKFDKLNFRRGDLVISEMVNYYWDWAQAKFSGETRKGDTKAEVQLEQAKEKGAVQFGGFSGRSEWPVIKEMYFSILIPSLRTPAHVLWTAGVKDITPMDKESIKAMFGALGIRNEGQRDVHHQVDTIIHIDYDHATGERSWTTVKERGSRQVQENMPLGDDGDLWQMYYDTHGLKPIWEV
jgi:hypothetical protein